MPKVLEKLQQNADEVEVEDTMDELIEHSLAYVIHRDNNDDDDDAEEKQCHCYSLHDIQLDFLKEMVSTDGCLRNYHAHLVDRYLELNNGSLLTIPSDGYAHWHLISHLLQAGRQMFAVELMRNFTWLQSCINYTSPVSVILTFRQVLSQAEKLQEIKDAMDELKDFEQLISIHAHLLSIGRFDLLQLALIQPTSDKVLEVAMTTVGKNRAVDEEKIYYKWINQPLNVMEDVHLTTRIHEGPVNCARFSAQTTKVVSCGDDQLVKIWNSETGEISHTFEGHTDAVHYVEFTDEDRKVVSCSSDHSIKVWSTITGKEIFTLLGHKDDVLCCACSSNGKMLASGSLDGTVKLWNMDTGFVYATFTDHEDVVNSCCFSSNCKYIASCSNDMFLKVWDVETKELICTGGGDADFISFCVFTPDDCGVVYTSLKFIKMFSLEEQLTKWTIDCSCDVLSVAYSPDQKFLASAHVDMAARLYDLENEVWVRVFSGHTSWLTSVTFCRINQTIVTSSADGVCTVWGIGETKYSIEKLKQHFDVSFCNPLQPRIAVCTNKNQLKVYEKDKLLTTSKRFERKLTACSISKHDRFVAIGFDSGDIKLLESKDLVVIHTFVHHKDTIASIDFGFDNTRLLGCDELVMTIWDTINGVLLLSCQVHTETITKCFLFDSDTKIASSSFDGYLKICDSSNGDVLESLPHDENLSAVMSCTLSDDGNLLASCSSSSEWKIWCTKTFGLLLTITDDDVIRCVSFSRDGKYLATGSDDGSAKVWNVKDGELICECKGHDIWIEDVRFEENNKFLLTVSDNIVIFDLAGKLIQTVPIIGSYLKTIRSTKDLSTCVTVDNLGYLYILKQL